MNKTGLRVTFLITSMEARAGMERVTASVTSGLAQRGVAVQLITINGQSTAFPLDPRVEQLHLNLPRDAGRVRSRLLPMIRTLRQAFRHYRPDVLIVVDSVLSIYAFPAALGLNIRRLAWEHFHLHYEYGLKQRRIVHRLVSLLGSDVVTLTEQDAQQWKKQFPGTGASIRAIANPLPFDALEKNPYALDNRTVLALGRLDDQKGFDLLLDAWSRVEAEFPEWSLRVLGNGEREQALRQQSQRLNLQRLTLGAATAQVEQEYRNAGIYVLSSRQEGLPMVLLESQAYGVPAVAFNCPTGPADVLAPGGGLLVQTGDIQGLADGLRHLMSNPQVRQDMSLKAFESSARYEARQIIDQWTELLEEQNDRRQTRRTLQASRTSA